MKIYEFIEPELDYFRATCNFSDEELGYLNYRAKHFTNKEIAIKMNMSEAKISNLARSVKRKINKAQKTKTE